MAERGRRPPLAQHMVNTIRRLRTHAGMSIRQIVHETGISKRTVEKYTADLPNPSERLGRPMTLAELARLDGQPMRDSNQEPRATPLTEFDDDDDDGPSEADLADACCACGRTPDGETFANSRVIAVGFAICPGCAVRERDNPEWAAGIKAALAAKPEDLSEFDDDPLGE